MTPGERLFHCAKGNGLHATGVACRGTWDSQYDEVKEQWEATARFTSSAPSSSSLREQVIEFHKAMNLPGQASSGDIPHVPSDDRVRLRAALIAEEFFETLHAMFDSEHIETFRTLLLAIAREAPVRVNLVEVADGLCDLAYVIEGTHLEFGMDSGPIAAEVHRSNLLKVGGPKSPLGKQLKPEGWTPPDIEGELRKQGWKP